MEEASRHRRVPQGGAGPGCVVRRAPSPRCAPAAEGATGLSGRDEAWREPWPKPEPQTLQFSALQHEPASTEELGGFHPHVTTASDLFLMCSLLWRDAGKETRLHKTLSGAVVFKGKRQETDTELCAPCLHRSSLAMQGDAAPEKAASKPAPLGQPN